MKNPKYQKISKIKKKSENLKKITQIHLYLKSANLKKYFFSTKKKHTLVSQY